MSLSEMAEKKATDNGIQQHFHFKWSHSQWFPILYLWPLLSSHFHIVADLATSGICEFQVVISVRIKRMQDT